MARRWLFLMLVSIIIGYFQPVSAHANLVRSDPPANTALDVPPTEIRLWFTEPLEPDFSAITLRDSVGDSVALPDSEIDLADPMQMMVRPGDLADGLYTVAWRAVSTSDGHATQGSFVFAVGESADFDTTPAQLDESIPVTSVMIRWVNLLSMAWALGAVGFWLFVWQPAMAASQAEITVRLWNLLWAGWITLGVSAGLLLVYQATLTQGVDLMTVDLGAMLTTRFGILWLARMILWLLMGGVLWLMPQDMRRLWLAFGLLLALIFTYSLFSHASAAQDQLPSVVNDWLHLVAAALWMGGLLAFGLIIGLVRRVMTDSTQTTGRLVGYFSNYARLTVAALMVSGLYSGWLQVGSDEALLNTVYGRTLIIKLILIVPLLFIAAINLLSTHKALRAGQAVWVGRLRYLVSLELVAGVAIFAAVGVMTSINPARDVWVFNQAQPDVTLTRPYFDSYFVEAEELHVDLEINPGLVGENTFTIWLYQHTGEPITDASRIRLRFNHLTENLGESELRLEHQGEGVYTVSGANLSVPGEWRLRVTVSRPNKFDVVQDFLPQIETQPKPPVVIVDTDFPVSQRLLVSGLSTVLLLGVGILAWTRRWSRPLVVVLSVGTLVLGLNALGLAGVISQRNGELVAINAWMRPTAAGQNGAVYMTLENGTDANAWVLSANTEAASSIEIHRTQIDNNIAHMHSVDVLEVPADGQAILEPAGTHMMLINLERDFVEGEQFPVMLELASGDELVVPVRVQLDGE